MKQIAEIKLKLYKKEDGTPSLSASYKSENLRMQDIAMLITQLEQMKLHFINQIEPDVELQSTEDDEE